MHLFGIFEVLSTKMYGKENLKIRDKEFMFYPLIELSGRCL
jgi:hypothetical protein